MSLCRCIVVSLNRCVVVSQSRHIAASHTLFLVLVAIQGNLKNFLGRSPALPCFDDGPPQYSWRLLKTLLHTLRNAPKIVLRVIFRSSKSDARAPPATACHELHRVFCYEAPRLHFTLPAFIAASLCCCVAVSLYQCVAELLCRCIAVSLCH